MDHSNATNPPVIPLSPYSKALLENLKKIKPKVLPDETARIPVSQTASFFAIAYEKVRNAVEYREGHLIRRAAIERILKRRLALNPQGRGEGENLVRELLWARYFSSDSLGIEDTVKVQDIIDKYLKIKAELKNSYSEFLYDLLTCEIEEILSPEEAKKTALFTFFIYQVLKDKVKIEETSEDQKNAYFYVSLEKSFNKNDTPYLRFHLFSLSYDPVAEVPTEKIQALAAKLPEMFKRIDSIIQNPYSERLKRFVVKQVPPFHILFELYKKKSQGIETILKNKQTLWTEVEQLCKEKYAQTRARLNNLAIKAIIYIFLTKMIFALLLEYPLSLYFYNEINYTALVANSIFPPALMFLIIRFTRIPGEDNTKKLFGRFIDIIDEDKSFEKTVSFITRKPRVRRPSLVFAFTIFYSFTFIITFALLYNILNLLHFNLVSQIVFVFFVSIISYFAYRIRHIAKEYQLQDKESFFRPFVDFFFIPILSVGKFLSRSIAKLNFFSFLFDFIIEAPFKLIIEVIEEWISFVRGKREEID